MTAGPTAGSSYTVLPTRHSKQAPATFKGHHRKFDRFIQHYDQLCLEKGITDAAHKCLGLPQYCSEEIAELIESLDSYIKRDYTALIKKLEWLFDTNRKKTEFHRGDLEDLIHSWRKKEITDLEKFSLYQREYTAVAAPLKAAGHLTEKDFNIGLWAGLHEGTRDRIERRIMTKNTQRDIKNPFEEAEIEEAAAHIFDRDRFDKHLREGQKGHRRIFEDRASKRRRNRKKRQDDSESDTDSDSEKSSDSASEKEETPRWTKSKSSRKARIVPAIKPEPAKKKTDKDEVSELVSKLEGMSIRDSTYRPTYVHLSMLAPHIAELYEKPEVRTVRSYQTQGPMPSVNPNAWRDQPPHSTMPPQRFNERREPTCYGCGERGHRMDQCSKIEAFITQGHIRRIDGRLRWADGSSISREPDESWAKAILRRVQHENQNTATGNNERSKGVYYVEVAREDSDADTDTQAEIGWMSGAAKVDSLQSYNVDRPSRISRDHRKGAQTNIPPGSHRMKEFPRGNREGPDRKKHSVAFDANQDNRQNRLQKIPTPTSRHVSPIILKRELNVDAVPMDIDKPSPAKVLDDVGKNTARGKERTTRDVTHVRAKKYRVEQEVVDELLKVPITLSVQKIAHISPRVRRDLAGALKAMKDNNMENSEDEHLKIETKAASEDLGKRIKSMRAEQIEEEISEDLLDNLDLREARSELLKIEATIGDAVMKGIVDTGSMVNMISAAKAEESGLPSVPLRRKPFKVIGVNGVTSICRSKIPSAEIFLTVKQHVTHGDLYVLDKADFDLLLGRPWGTYNGVGIEERVRGTYVSYITGVMRYEVNASKARSIPVRIGRADVELAYRNESDTSVSDEEGEEPLEALTARIIRDGTDQSYVPDSDEDQLGPGYIRKETDSEEERLEFERANRRVKDKIAEWRREQDEEADDEREGGRGGEDRSEGTPPPNQLDKGKRKAYDTPSESEEAERPPKKARKRNRGNIIEVDEDMEEEYITMTQDDVDEKEWEEFYAREGKRLSKNNEQWVRWLETSESEKGTSEDVDDTGLHTPTLPEGSSAADEPPASSPEPSHTLRTPGRKPRTPPKKSSTPKTRIAMAERAVRRSHRLRQSTRCTLCNEDLVPRVRRYERKYKISREKSRRTYTTSNNKPNSDDPDNAPALSLCTRIIWTNTEEDESSVEMGNVESRDRGSYQGIRPPSPPPVIGRIRNIVKYRSARENIPQDNYDREDEEPNLRKSIPDMISELRVEVQQELTRKYWEKRGKRQSDTDDDPHDFQQKEGEGKGSSSEGSEYGTTAAERERQGDETTRQPAWPRAEGGYDSDTNAQEPIYPSERPGHLGFNLGKYLTKGGAVRRRPQPRPVDPTQRIVQQWMKDLYQEEELRNVITNGDNQPIDDNRVARTDRLMKKGRNAEESGTTKPEGSPKEDADTKRHDGTGGVSPIPTPKDVCKQQGVSSGDSNESIKSQRKGRGSSHLPTWLHKRLRSSKFLKATCKVLLSLLALLLLLLILSAHRTNNLAPRLTMTYQAIDRHEDGIPEPPQYQGRPYALVDGHVPRAHSLDHPTNNEVAESVIHSISTPPGGQFTPGIVAIRHLVPLAVTSSRRTREYLGKAATVTFRTTTGRKASIQGDVHVRIVPKGTGNGWDEVDCPSPAEVHHTQDLLFYGANEEEEGQYRQVNHEIRRAYDEPPTRELVPIEDLERNGRTPPSTPNDVVKIGPPGLRRSGRKRISAPSLSADGESTVRNGKQSKSPSEEDYVVVPDQEKVSKENRRLEKKTKNGGNVPFRAQVSSQAGPVFAQPANDDDEDADTSPPPKLLYPAGESYERTKPCAEGEDHAMDCENAEEVPDSPESADTLAERPDQKEGLTRGTEEIYAEILDVLRRLRFDLAAAVDLEATQLINDAERDASHLLGMRIRREMERKDRDGDIEMEGGGEEGRRTVPTYRPISPVSETSEVNPYAPKVPSELRMEEIEDRVQRIEGEVREAQWKAAGAEYKVDDKLVIFESRLAAMEVRKAEEAEGWKTVQPNRRKPRAPATRGNKNRGGVTEGKVDAIKEEIFGVQMRMGDIEQALKGVERWQVQISAMDLKMEGRVAEAALWVKKVGELEAKWDELRLRQDVITRDIGQGKAAVNLGLSPRISKMEAAVAKFEAWMKGAEFRFGTYEEQASWADQKIRGVYHLAVQDNASERFIFSATVRTVWESAAKAYEERMRHAPPKLTEGTVDPQAQHDEDDSSSQSTSVVLQVPKIDNLPAPNSKPPASY